MSTTYWFAVCAAPVALLVLGGRLAPGARLAVIATCAAAWGAITGLITWVGDPGDVSLALLLYFVIAPFVTSAIAAVVATRVVGLRGRFVPAFLLGTMGWVIGLAIGMIVVFAADLDELLDNATAIALPAIYTACAAVIAAAIRED